RHRAPGRGRAPDEESRRLAPDGEVREAEARQRADQGNDQGAARPAPQPGLREVAGARAEHSDGKGMTPSRREFLAVGAAAAASTLASPARAQWQPSPRYPDPSIKIVDPRFAKYRVASAKVERLATGHRWCEGPVWFGDGRYLLWSDIPNDRIMKWEEETGAVSVFRKPSSYANGNTRDRQGRLLTCEHYSRRVTRTEPDGTITVI